MGLHLIHVHDRIKLATVMVYSVFNLWDDLTMQARKTKDITNGRNLSTRLKVREPKAPALPEFTKCVTLIEMSSKKFGHFVRPYSDNLQVL